MWTTRKQIHCFITEDFLIRSKSLLVVIIHRFNLFRTPLQSQVFFVQSVTYVGSNKGGCHGEGAGREGQVLQEGGKPSHPFRYHVKQIGNRNDPKEGRGPMPPLNTSLRSLLLQPTRRLVAFCPRSLVACWFLPPVTRRLLAFCPRSLVACWFLPPVTRRLLALCSRSLVACWLSAHGHSSPAGSLPPVTRRLLAFCSPPPPVTSRLANSSSVCIIYVLHFLGLAEMSCRGQSLS